MDPITLTILGALAGYLLAKSDIIGARVLGQRRIRKNLRSEAHRLQPRVFVTPMCVWEGDGREFTVELDDDLIKVWSEFLRSRTRILVISGAFGMGKTWLIRQILAHVTLTNRKARPIYINSQHLVSQAIFSEIVRLTSEAIGIEIGTDYMRGLLDDTQGIVVFDALDQMPYSAGVPNTLDAVLDFVEREGKRENSSRIVLVVREEFISFVHELRQFLDNVSIWRVKIQGFRTDAQMKEALNAHLPEDSTAHWSRLKTLTTNEPSFREVFVRPITLARYAAIGAEELDNMASTGTTMADIFKLSFGKIDDQSRLDLERLAFAMYGKHRYDVHLRSFQLIGDVPHPDRIRELAATTGLITIDQNLCQFAHASYRDFFVASSYLRGISNGDIAFVGERLINYLVSEFTAELLEESTLLRMLSLVSRDSGAIVLTNVADILSELENPSLKGIASEYFANELDRVAGAPMNNYTVGLYTNAGIMGFSEQIDIVISHAKEVGLSTFLQNFFPTRDNFAYYNGSQERCEIEFANIVSKNKYSETRRLLAFFSVKCDPFGCFKRSLRCHKTPLRQERSDRP